MPKKLLQVCLFCRKRALTAEEAAKEVAKEPYERKKFQCPLCENAMYDLNRHLRFVHHTGPYRDVLPEVIRQRRKGKVSYNLTHRSQVMPFGNIDLGQQWPQAITEPMLTNRQ